MKHESKITEGADFIMDTKMEHSKNIFSKRMKITLWITVILTGFLSIGAVGSFFWAVVDRMWQEWGTAEFVLRELIHLCILICFISLIQVAVNGRKGRPFSKILVRCVWLIGGMFAAASIIIPRLEGYRSSGFEVLSSGENVFCDGSILFPGLLLIVLGGLLKAGLEMQREVDTIL